VTPRGAAELSEAATSLEEATRALTSPGQMFEMEEVEIRGEPTRVWKHCPPDLRAVLEMSRSHDERVFLVYEDERMSFEEHYRSAARIAHALKGGFGLEKGERVSIAMRNLPEWVMTFWGAAVAGGILVPLNAWWTGPELEFALSDSETSVVVVDSARFERIGPHLKELTALRLVVVTDEDRRDRPLRSFPAANPDLEVIPFAQLLGDLDSNPSLPEVSINPDDDVTIFYTSGTTGVPKGAVGTHRNMTTNLMSLFFVNSRASMRGASLGAENPQDTHSETGDSETEDSQNGQGREPSQGPGESRRNGPSQGAYLLSVPLFHATGCHSILLANTAAGNKLVMMHHWDPERALELIERERITTFGGVPAMVMQVIDSPSFAVRDTSSVRAVAYGGAPAPPDLVRRIKEHFPVGSPSNGYGLTETSSVTTMNSGDDYVRKPDSVGPPVPVCDVAVLAEDFNEEEPSGENLRGPSAVGELWVKGPNVVRGYWRRPEESAATFTRGWLHTGDIGRIDEEGFVYVVDRAKDMVIRGGENVYCVEVEAALFEHPAVSDVAVIGVPHPVLGEEVGAAVILRPETKVTADELARHAREQLAAFMVPTHFWFLSEPLPRNPQGKVLKRELRDKLLSEPEGADRRR
jgi:long-chain acyl-CoA synthetase